MENFTVDISLDDEDIDGKSQEEIEALIRERLAKQGIEKEEAEVIVVKEQSEDCDQQEIKIEILKGDNVSSGDSKRKVVTKEECKTVNVQVEEVSDGDSSNGKKVKRIFIQGGDDQDVDVDEIIKQHMDKAANLEKKTEKKVLIMIEGDEDEAEDFEWDDEDKKIIKKKITVEVQEEINE